MDTLICVLGMHRSTTSMMCQILHRQGISFGDESHLYEGDEYNKDGYYEIKNIRLMYDEMLCGMGSSLRGSKYLDAADYAKIDINRYSIAIAASIEDSMEENKKICGYKEPTTSMLLPICKKSFEKVSKRQKYIVTVRNPIEVAASLSKREGMNREHSFRMYLNYYIHILVDAAFEDIIFCSKEQILSDEQGTFNRLIDFIYEDEDRAEISIDDYKNSIKRDYLHSAHDLAEVREGLLRDVYEYLLTLCEGKEIDIEKASEYRDRYIRECEPYAVEDAYWEVEYRKSQLLASVSREKIYEKWITSLIKKTDIITYLMDRDIKHIGLLGEGSMHDIFISYASEALKVDDTRWPEIEKEGPYDIFIIFEEVSGVDVKKRVDTRFRLKNMQVKTILFEELINKANSYGEYKIKSQRAYNSNKVLILKSKSLCYDSTYFFADKIYDELKRLSYEPYILDINNASSDELLECMNTDYKAVIDFNSYIPCARIDSSEHYLDKIGAPFYNILIDHPMYYHPSLKEELEEYNVICIDDEHRRYVEKYYKNIKNVYFMPLAGIERENEEVLPISERRYDVLLPATYKNLESYIQDIDNAIPEIREGVYDIIDIMKSDLDISVTKAFNMMMNNNNIHLKDEDYAAFFHAHFLADMYMGAYYRDYVVRRLLNSGQKVCVCGQGWDNYRGNGCENLNIIDAVDYAHINKVMGEAKIVLNIMGNFKENCHDRVLTAMLTKSVCISNYNRYIGDIFGENEIITFKNSEIDNLDTIIKNALSDENRLQQMADTAYEHVIKEHTWNKRINKFIENNIKII